MSMQGEDARVAAGRRLEILVSLTVAGTTINEDLVGATADCAWVIDGATGVGEGLLPVPSDAAWFAAQADLALRELLSAQPGSPTAELLRAVMSRCRQALERDAARLDWEPHEHPSAAIAMVRLRPEGLELTTLGDCQIAYRDAEGAVRLFGTSGIDVLERGTLALAARLLAEDPAMTPAELRIRLTPQLQENRRRMNTVGGYWVLSTDPAAADHLDQIVIAAANARAALASDGFLRLVHLFATATPADLLDLETEADAVASLAALRALEAEDPDCRRHLRVKPADDASLMVVRVAAAQGE